MKKISKLISEKNIFILIGVFLITHWILLVIDRITYDIIPNLFWLSHLVLLIAGIAFILRSNLLLSGSLISVLLIHGLWIYDFIILLVTGNSPLNYTPYVLGLSFYRILLTLHHIYLIPLLLTALWRQKQINKYAWLIASALFAFATISSSLLPRGYNLNCAHYICPMILNIFPFLGFLTTIHPIAYLFILNIATYIIIFLLFNTILYYIFKKYIK